MTQQLYTAQQYLHYLWHSSNGKGHGTHSPFVYEFVTQVLQGATSKPIAEAIEQQRKLLLHNSTRLQITDFGAGSHLQASNYRAIKQIAATALKPKKYGQLLHRIVQHYRLEYCVEIGTCLGITSSYIAKANALVQLHSLEGAVSFATQAKQVWTNLSINNIHLHLGHFNDTLAPTLQLLPQVDFAFIDGNHQLEPTLNYFEQILAKSQPNTIIVADDIYWSKPMQQAWKMMQQHPKVTASINLFFIGILLINPSFKEKQHFTIYY